MKPLVIDVGGTHVKLCARSVKTPLKFRTERRLTPKRLIAQVKLMTADWDFDRIALGVPALVSGGRITAEPGNLGDGWVGFNFRKAFGVPVRIMNDGAMQALGAYVDKRMLFLGMGTGLGSAIVSDRTIIALELGDLLHEKKLLSEHVNREAYYALGKVRWRKAVIGVAQMLKTAFAADYVVLGGGKAGKGVLEPLPKGLRSGGNEDAFRGGFRLWEDRIEQPGKLKSRAWRFLS